MKSHAIEVFDWAHQNDDESQDEYAADDNLKGIGISLIGEDANGCCQNDQPSQNNCSIVHNLREALHCE